MLKRAQDLSIEDLYNIKRMYKYDSNNNMYFDENDNAVIDKNIISQIKFTDFINKYIIEKRHKSYYAEVNDIIKKYKLSINKEAFLENIEKSPLLSILVKNKLKISLSEYEKNFINESNERKFNRIKEDLIKPLLNSNGEFSLREGMGFSAYYGSFINQNKELFVGFLKYIMNSNEYDLTTPNIIYENVGLLNELRVSFKTRKNDNIFTNHNISNFLPLFDKLMIRYCSNEIEALQNTYDYVRENRYEENGKFYIIYDNQKYLAEDLMFNLLKMNNFHIAKSSDNLYVLECLYAEKKVNIIISNKGIYSTNNELQDYLKMLFSNKSISK